jgi:REP element-mobilizing transposase RayT
MKKYIIVRNQELLSVVSKRRQFTNKERCQANYSENKSQFLDYLEEACKQMMIRLVAYCVMDNHYHPVLENSSGRMSDFLKLLNGQYGMYYRKMYGGKGYKEISEINVFCNLNFTSLRDL